MEISHKGKLKSQGRKKVERLYFVRVANSNIDHNTTISDANSTQMLGTRKKFKFQTCPSRKNAKAFPDLKGFLNTCTEFLAL